MSLFSLPIHLTAIADLNRIAHEWKLCKRRNGMFEVEAFFHDDDGFSRCGEYSTMEEAVGRAIMIGDPYIPLPRT